MRSTYALAEIDPNLSAAFGIFFFVSHFHLRVDLYGVINILYIIDA